MNETPFNSNGHPGGKKTVLLIEDHAIVRQGLARLINLEADLEVCGEAEDGQQQVSVEADRLKPDIIVVDISLPGMNGIEFIKNVKTRHPDMPIIVLSNARLNRFTPSAPFGQGLLAIS